MNLHRGDPHLLAESGHFVKLAGTRALGERINPAATSSTGRETSQ
jgi:hypothetical protein